MGEFFEIHSSDSKLGKVASNEVTWFTQES